MNNLYIQSYKPLWYKLLRGFYRYFSQLVDPIKVAIGVKEYFKYFKSWRQYSALPGAESINLLDTYPQVHDCTSNTAFDAHYFYVNGWAMRKILANNPTSHIDIGSQIILSNLLAAVIPTTFLDYRPLQANLDGLSCIAGDILNLPFESNSIHSLSCLHVAEHIGLGRYGDPLDPMGTQKAARELQRVLAPGGNLYFALPIGEPRLCFNAHRIHSVEAILSYFPELDLVEFSGVHDDGRFVDNVELTEFNNSGYACGMFCFRKPIK
jgi:SAM-dependent methyltransferase